jgi:hypothetical protein
MTTAGLLEKLEHLRDGRTLHQSYIKNACNLHFSENNQFNISALRTHADDIIGHIYDNKEEVVYLMVTALSVLVKRAEDAIILATKVSKNLNH